MKDDTVHAIETRCAPAFRIAGTEPPRPQFGETPERYHFRVLSCAQALLPAGHTWEGIPIARQPSLAAVEDHLVHDRVAEFKKPEGPLRSMTTRDGGGRDIVRWFGDPGEAWAPFKQVPRLLTHINSELGTGENSVGAKASREAARHELGLAFEALAEKRAAGL